MNVRNFSYLSKVVILFLGAILVSVFAGCGEEEIPSKPVSTVPLPLWGVAEPFDRDNQNYLFKHPKSYKVSKFEIKYWLPTLGAADKGPDPNFWKCRYLTDKEIIEREIDVERKTRKRVYEEDAREVTWEVILENVLQLEVPERYESWYEQAYGSNLFDEIVMRYGAIIIPNRYLGPLPWGME